MCCLLCAVAHGMALMLGEGSDKVSEISLNLLPVASLPDKVTS